MQSVRAGAVQTYFFIFTLFLKSRSNKTIFVQTVIIGWKKAFQKNTSKKLPRQTQTGTYYRVPGPLDSHPYVKDFSNKKQLSEQETRTAAHFWVYFWSVVLKWVIFVQSLLFDFRFRLTIHFRLVAPMRTHGWWSDTPWAMARRILLGQGRILKAWGPILKISRIFVIS